MAISIGLIKAGFAVAFVFAGAQTAVAQAQSAAESEPRVITEDFDGDDRSLMLGGQIHFEGDSKPWMTFVANGKLVMENRIDPRVLHYNDIKWIKYPGSTILETTEASVISVDVESQNKGRGGAGLLVGSGKRGHYLAYFVDAEGRYHVVRKDGRNTRSIHSAKHPAILVGQANRLSFETRGSNIAFFANGSEVIQIPNPKRGMPSRPDDAQSGVGLAAFGIGIFTFDDVEIRPAN